MKRLIEITKAKTKWAKERVKEYGPIVQVAADETDQFRFVSPSEEDTWDFKEWSYWVKKDEIECKEINLG